MFLSSKIKENEVQNYSLQKSFGALFVLAAMFFSGTAAAQVTQVLVNTGRPDGKLGALSRPASANKSETETADDFVFGQTTVITGATITGLITPATPLASIANVEVELYHRFPEDLLEDLYVILRVREIYPVEVVGAGVGLVIYPLLLPVIFLHPVLFDFSEDAAANDGDLVGTQRGEDLRGTGRI